MHTTQFPALYHRIYLSVTVLRLQRPEVRIPPAAPKVAPIWALPFLFCMRFYGRQRGDSNSCKGDRHLRRKQGAEAGAAVAEGKPRPRGAARCGHRNPYSARCLTSRRAKKPLRGFFRARRAQYPLRLHKTRTPLHGAEACGSHRSKRVLPRFTNAKSRRCTARWCGRR